MRHRFSIIICLQLILSVSGSFHATIQANLFWDWSFNGGTEMGQLKTTGDVVDLGGPATFDVLNMSLTATDTTATLGDVASGPYIFSSTIGTPPFSLDWNGSSVSAFHDQTDQFGAPGLIEMSDPSVGLLTQIRLGFTFSNFQGGLTVAEVGTSSGFVSTATGAGPLTVTPVSAPPPPVNPFVGPIALSGGIAPTGNGFFGNLGGLKPVINLESEVAFAARLVGSSGGVDDDMMLIRGDVDGLTKIAREGEFIDAGNFEEFVDFNQVQLNDDGQVGFEPGIDDPAQGVFQDTGIFRGDGAAAPIRVVIETESEPGADDATFESFEQLSMNNGGQIAWRSDLANAQSSGGGIYRSGGGSITTIVRAQRDGLADGSEFERNFGTPMINNVGHVAFRTNLTETPGGNTDDSAIFRGFEEKDPVLIVREGDDIPGTGQYDSFSDVGLNDGNQVAFVAELRSTTGGSIDNRGLYRGDETTIVELARKGLESPDGIGVFDNFRTPLADGPQINNSNDIVVEVSFAGTGVDSENNRGLLLSDENGLSIIAREGNAAPGGGQFAGSFGDPVLNDLGQVVFTDVLDGSGIDNDNNFGLYAFDPNLGLLKIFREGDFVNLGSGDLRMIDNGGISFGEGGLNDAGFLAVALSFTDGTSGIFRSSIAFVNTPLPGDFDEDADVDLDDLALWELVVGVNAQADADDDNDSDGRDFLAWQQNFNGSVNALAQFQAVPEPGVLALLAPALCGIFLKRQQ